MLSMYFRVPTVLARLRAGLAGPFLDGFTEELVRMGFRPNSIRNQVHGACHFGDWVGYAGLTVATLTDSTVMLFRQHFPECECGFHTRALNPGRATHAARHFLGHLRNIGVTPPEDKAPARVPEHPALKAFLAWMEQHRGVRPATLQVYGRLVSRLLLAIDEDPRVWSPQLLRAFVLGQGAKHGRHYTKLLVTAMRMFLRFLAIHGDCKAELVDSIPTVAEWRLSALPRGLPPGDVEILLASCDDSGSVGARDQAILLLLCRLGLRAGEVAELRFGDLDWRSSTLRLLGKGRRETLLPLPQEIENAILAYLDGGRPPFNDDHVFLRALAPWGPIHRSAVADIVDRALQRASITGAPSKGAHMLLHSAASALLRQGSTLDAIGAVLRHRSVETTALYAKVDLDALLTIAQPWPGEPPC